MPFEGQELVGRNGFRLKLHRITDDRLEMEGFYSGEGGLPPNHLHPRQDEHFEVLEGAVRAVIDGAEEFQPVR
jgi:mannose-6-phosphate isomerase-like protein (cupin superfamily)